MTWSSLAWAPPGFPSRRAARRLDGIRRGRCEAGRRIHAGDRGLRDPLRRGQQPRHRHQGPRPRRHGLHDQRQVRHPLHRRLRLHLRPSLRRLCGRLREQPVTDFHLAKDLRRFLRRRSVCFTNLLAKHQSFAQGRGIDMPFTLDSDGQWEAEQIQSTLPAWGATSVKRNPPSTVVISIHAPRVGSDALVECQHVPVRNISIHAPRVGSD